MPWERPAARSPPFPTVLATTDASDLDVQIGTVGGYALNVVSPAEQRAHLQQLAQLPDVGHVAAYMNLFVAPLSRNGTIDLAPAMQDNAVDGIGSVNNMYFDQDRVTVSQGRMADPRSDNEFVATAQAEHLLGWHLGEVVPMGAFTLQQVNSPDPARSKPYFRVSAKLVGTIAFASQVVSDDVEDLGVLRALGASPAMTMADGLLGVLGAVVVGSVAVVLANVVAAVPGRMAASTRTALLLRTE